MISGPCLRLGERVARELLPKSLSLSHGAFHLYVSAGPAPISHHSTAVFLQHPPSTSSIVLGVGGVEEDELRLQGRVLRKRFVVEPRLPLQARRGKSVRMAVADINQRFSTDGVSAPVCQTPVNNWGRGSDCHSIPIYMSFKCRRPIITSQHFTGASQDGLQNNTDTCTQAKFCLEALRGSHGLSRGVSTCQPTFCHV